MWATCVKPAERVHETLATEGAQVADVLAWLGIDDGDEAVPAG